PAHPSGPAVDPCVGPDENRGALAPPVPDRDVAARHPPTRSGGRARRVPGRTTILSPPRARQAARAAGSVLICAQEFQRPALRWMMPIGGPWRHDRSAYFAAFVLTGQQFGHGRTTPVNGQ